MSAPSTNIRVFVHWTEQTVFAGEDIECEITFKNIAVIPATASPSRALLHPSGNGFASGGDKQRKPPTTQIRSPSNLNPRPLPPSRGHRSTLSLNVPTGRRSGPGSGSWNGGFPKASVDGTTHQRSLSIISIGASESAIDQSSNGTDGTRRLSRGHGRSASLQIVPRRPGLNGGAPLSAPLGQRSSTHPSTHPSPLLNSSFPPSLGSETVLPRRPSRRPGASTAPNTPVIAGPPFTNTQIFTSFSKAQAWKFPTSVSPSEQDPVEHNKTEDAKNNGHQLLSPKSRETIPKIAEHAAPVARILFAASITGTPRSSGEFYSLSNNSTETLASEYTSQTPARIPLNGVSHTRRPSNLVPANHHRPPETLMMGYAQIHGSFTLDASLISQTPFEEVKRKGAVGGQGGGVIGVENKKRDSGLLRSFGWGNIGESLGGFLGGGELSSIKDMRGIASSRDIPLLSTPQSLLFVDLRLAPGESKSYKYSFKLPKGLPPSHRGKAIKITYKLVIGTQRPGGAKEQQVKSVEIPFRVLGSVNSHGELLGHDLMAPYIILRDQARIHTLEKSSSFSSIESAKQPRHEKSQKESTLDDFLAYADELLAHPRKNSSLGLLSPTEVPRSRRQSFIEEPTTAKEAIDMAILRSNVATESLQSANRFEIARSGRRVAVVMLARPAYRLGETVTVAVDFTDAEIPCYAVHAALETAESVDSGIALRSEASILRVTRKVHVSHSESALFARRIIFSPAIPITSTPEFITSGISLDWKVRIEFVTPRLVADNGAAVGYADLLEEVSKDDRGAILAPAEAIECESFEISVPLRVYGALAGNTEQEERSSDEGLVV